MITIRNLRKTFGSVKAVQDLSLELSGEIFGLLGPNGAGKTTSIKMMTGLLKPDEGQILLMNIDLQKEPLEAKKVFGLVLEEPFLYSRLTPREFLSLIGSLYGMRKNRLVNRISYLFEIFDMENYADKLISSLSRGTKQKVALSGALVHNPSILFLDEPLSGLDPQSVYNLKQELKGIVEKGGTILMSTHILDVAQTLCDRVGIINQGILLACGSLEELHKEAKSSSKNLEDIFLKLTSQGKEP
jgi:ABC-2 type transport system ATP-binding protein